VAASLSSVFSPQGSAARLAQSASQALPPGVAVVALAVLALNLLDAFLTLAHIWLGAIELNPLMRHFLEHGPADFVVAKHLMVGAGVLAMAALCRHPVAFAGLRFLVLPVYTMVVLYQVALLAL
jgi:hypothetical protein